MPKISGSSRSPDVGMKLPQKRQLPGPVAAPAVKTERVAAVSINSQIESNTLPKPVSTGRRVPRPPQRCGHYIVEPRIKEMVAQIKKQHETKK